MFSNRQWVSTAFAIAVFVLCEAYLRWYEYFWLIVPLALLLVFALVWLSVVDSVLTKNFWLYTVTPGLFILAVLAFLTINEVGLVHHLAIGVATFLLWLYAHNIYQFNYDFEQYSEKSIENVSNYINLITFFVTSLSMYASAILVGLPFWLLLLLMVGVTWLIGVQSLWSAALLQVRSLMYLLILSMIVAEVFWVVAYLPTDFYVSGFLLTMSFYVVWGLLKSNLYGIVTQRLIRRYLIIASITVLLVSLTTVWY